MTSLTPDHIAQLASRLYSESPGGHGAGLGGGPLPPVDPAADSMAREQVQAPATPLPPETLPAFDSPIFQSHAPAVAPVASAAPVEAFRGPTEFGSQFGGHAPSFGAGSSPSPSGFPATSSGGSQTDGLRAFVQSIRRSDFRSSTEAFPNGEPKSTSAPTAASATTNHAPGNSRPAAPQFPTFEPAPYPRDDAANGYGARPLDVDAVRRDFPILHQRVHGRPLVWLDNAATTQKPQSVIDALSYFYEHDNSNIHRGAHTLAGRATEGFEQARDKVRDFLGASSSKEIVFVRGTTEAINLVAQTWGRKFLQPDDEIVLSTLEHHANIVPWQLILKETGARLRVIPVNDRGEIILEEYQKILGPRTKLVALAHASNSIGTLLPIAEMTQMAKRYGARVLIDGAQTVAHVPVNVQQLGSDFYVFSGHKIFGPTGIGVLQAREELLDIMPPWQGGGSMIKNVTFEDTTYADPPAKFEAGTPNIADAVGLGAALDYVRQFGLPNIAQYEHELLAYATEALSRINGLRLIGTAREKVGVLSFVLQDRPTIEVGRLLDLEGIAVRAGHHCSQPSLRRFGLEATVRPSLAFYNKKDEIDRLADAIRRIQRR
jgi:cysteine desulfurase/selenocysteine lyase